VTSSAPEIEETTLSKDDDTMAIGEFVAIDLVLDVFSLDTGVFIKTIHINLVVEMTDVTNDSVVLHLGHVVSHNDALVTSAGDVNIGSLEDRFESLDLVTFHAGLESTDRIAFGDNNTCTTSFHSLGTSLTNITKSANDDLLSGDHDISGTHETIGKGVSASVNIVELLLGDAVIDVDGFDEEFTSVGHLFKSEDTSGSFLRDTVETGKHVSPFLCGSGLESFLNDSEDLLHLTVLGGHGVGEGSVLLELKLVL